MRQLFGVVHYKIVSFIAGFNKPFAMLCHHSMNYNHSKKRLVDQCSDVNPTLLYTLPDCMSLVLSDTGRCAQEGQGQAGASSSKSPRPAR